MYLTIFSTKSESSDHYLYKFISKKKPTNQQIEWWLKENAIDKDCDYCYESINEVEFIKLDSLKEIELHSKDPFPNMSFL